MRVMRKKILIVIAVLLSFSIVYASDSVEEKWKTTISGDVIAGEAIDFDHDGMPDGGYFATTFKLYALSSEGVKWSMPVTSLSDIAKADLDGDGYKDEVVVAGDNVYAYDENQNILWNFSIQGDAYSITIGNLDDDKADEVIIGGWNKVYAINDDGILLWDYEVSGSVKNVVVSNNTVYIAVGISLIALDFNGNRKWSELAENNIVGLGLVDINGDGIAEGVAYGDSGGNVTAFNENEEAKWSIQKYYESGEIKIIPYDQDTDGKEDETLVKLYNLYAIDNGNQIWSISARNTFAKVDFDGDGILDDIVTASDKNTYFYNANGVIQKIKINDKEYDKYNETGANVMVAFDLDGDGKRDDIILASNKDYTFRALKVEIEDTTGGKIGGGRVIILANSIDWGLAGSLVDFLENKGFTVVHATAENFDQYKEEKFIIILGGHKAPEGIGEIVGELLYPEDEMYIEEKGKYSYWDWNGRKSLKDKWSKGQKIAIFAGNTRKETSLAHIEFRGRLIS